MRESHCHTIHSPDASREATLTAYVKTAENRGLTHLTFTDHVDYEAKAKIFDQIPDFTAIKQSIDSLQKTTPVTLQMGVELGYQPQVLTQMNALIAAHPFDQVILSVHYVKGFDPYDGSLFEGRSKEAALTLYFEAVLEAIEAFDDFHILAHIDYVFRYLDGGIDDLDLTAFTPLLDPIFQTLIQKKKVLEVNTAPYRKSYAVSEPFYALIAHYYALGGRLISLGSDAHHPHDLLADFKAAATRLKAIGFETVTFIENQRQTSTPLNRFTLDL